MLSMITVELCTKKLAFTQQGNCNLNKRKLISEGSNNRIENKNFLNTSFPFHYVISINLIKIL